MTPYKDMTDEELLRVPQERFFTGTSNDFYFMMELASRFAEKCKENERLSKELKQRDEAIAETMRRAGIVLDALQKARDGK
jgi:hypothetical protein